MIIKGGSRAAPGQLAWHLQRRDTNERVDILELQSPASTLGEAFRDWQILSEGTRGFKGLYHANIDPAQDYTMTREQWQHAVDVLEKELKLEGQPRAVVMHEKFGREHIHVVWARTDIDEMVLRSDSQNYLAHERASQRLEMEFGHEPVPGKHAKRDREQQPEFPRAEANQAEWQQGERTGIDPAARKDQITALKEACDNAQAFKVALEEQGYILAKGDRRDFVIVDETGSIHSLGRQIRDVKAAELREFMKGIDRETLPTAAQAKDLQQQRQEQLRPQEPAQQQPQQPEPSPAEPPPEPPAGSSSEPPPQQPQQQEPKEEEPHQQQEAKPADAPPEPAPDPNQVRAEALRKALAERQAEEGRRLVESQRAEMDQLRQALDRETREKLERFDAIHRAETEALRREQQEASSGFAGFMDSVQDFFNPARAAERQAERQRELQQHAARLKQERDDYVALIQKTNALEIDNREERHALRLHDLEVRGAEERDRYLREQELARKLEAENEERERQLAEQRARDGPRRTR
jgi:outer membrane biosynthesis protein TonB